MEIRIRSARAEDLPACAVCWGNRRDTYPSIYPFRLADPSVTDTDRLARNVRDLQAMLDDNLNVFTIAQDIDAVNEPKVVGYMIWSTPEAFLRDFQRFQAQAREYDSSVEGPHHTATASNTDVDPECDQTLSAKLKLESMTAKQRAAGGQRFWFLQQLFVHPAYQRRGVGTKMMEDGLAYIENLESKCSEAEVAIQKSASSHKIALTSSPQGKALYERYGFSDVYWFNPHFQDIDENGRQIQRSARWPLMLKSA